MSRKIYNSPYFLDYRFRNCFTIRLERHSGRMERSGVRSVARQTHHPALGHELGPNEATSKGNPVKRESSHRFLDSGSRPATRVLAGMTSYDTTPFVGMTREIHDMRISIYPNFSMQPMLLQTVVHFSPCTL